MQYQPAANNSRQSYQSNAGSNAEIMPISASAFKKKYGGEPSIKFTDGEDVGLQLRDSEVFALNSAKTSTEKTASQGTGVLPSIVRTPQTFTEASMTNYSLRPNS